ncbi:flagellar assembly protein T N-terminal domain-containing protein [Aliagarivorans marinus]|uniref:flagellar assembly protein T N-terminal domain-containing protein n=1 Tax=Aliagarivorans marinus TaxID=561965 RepID=UPI00040FC1AE|nr:flagellar assembly protein T N-terminal domain-containing protein [Aliagarivorans marinus]
MKQLALILALLLHSVVAQAEWMQAQGRSAINGLGKQQARSEATQDAVKQLLLYSGASVTAISQVNDGKLTLDQLEVVSKGNLHNVQIVKEWREGDHYYVEMGADVFPILSQCKASGYSKNLLLLPPFLKPQATINVGQLHDMSPAVEQRSYDIAREVAQQFNVLHPPKLPQNYYKPGSHNYQGIKDLAKRYDAQYLLGLEIENISLDRKHQPKHFTLSYPNRYFVVNVRVYNAVDLEEIYNKRYSLHTEWRFKAEKIVYPASAEFWLSDYGDAVNDMLYSIIRDIDALLACQPLQGYIVRQLDEDRWQINLGHNNQIQPGMLLDVDHQRFHWGDWQIPRQERQPVGTALKVEQVYQRNAIVQAVDPSMSGNIQLGDMVSKY